MQDVLANVRIFTAGRQLATASTNFYAIQENEIPGYASHIT